MPGKHTGILNPGIIVWEVALLYNLLLRPNLELSRRNSWKPVLKVALFHTNNYVDALFESKTE